VSGVENHIKSLNEKHADLEAKIAAENNRPLPDSLVLKGLRLNKADVKKQIIALGGQTDGMAKEAALVEAKKTEMAADEEPLPDVEIVQASAPEQTAFVAAECYGHMPNPVEKAA
jgi:hypothetical protein